MDMVRKAYNQDYKKNEYDKKAVNEYASKFSEGLEKGWKQAGSKIDFESPDNKMLNSLKENVWNFSAAKNKEELNQLNALLRDEKGKLRTWTSFKEEAIKVTKDFKERYMRVEYDMAVNASYSAARWEDYDDDAVLVYTTAGDDRVRESHEELDGITLPKNHSFWDTFYPPNGWNCRCTTFPTTTNRRTPDDDIPGGVIDNVPPIFRTNIAKKGLAFPEKHPYFKNKVKWTGKKERIKVNKRALEIREWAKENLLTKKIRHPMINDDIEFNISGLKEALNQPHINKEQKNEAVLDIVKRIEKGTYIKTSPDHKGREQFEYHYISTQISDKESFIVLRKDKHNKKTIFYSIVDKLK